MQTLRKTTTKASAARKSASEKKVSGIVPADVTANSQSRLEAIAKEQGIPVWNVHWNLLEFALGEYEAKRISFSRPDKRTVAKPITSPRPSVVGVRKFSVNVRWVEITAAIPQSDLDELNQIFGGDFNDLRKADTFRGYGSSLWIVASAFERTGEKSPEWFKFGSEASMLHWTLMRGRKMAEIRFSVEEQQGLGFIANCKVLKASPDALIRGAFQRRLKKSVR
jgi:hypothetical protein